MLQYVHIAINFIYLLYNINFQYFHLYITDITTAVIGSINVRCQLDILLSS